LFRLKARYFPLVGKVPKGTFKGEDFDFFPLKKPLFETTKRGPAGPLVGFPPGNARYWIIQ